MNFTLSRLIVVLLAASCLVAPAQSPDPATVTNNIKPEAMELLRRVIAEQQKNPDKIIRAPSSTNTVTKAGLEKQYLAGQLTAKQYQKALDQLEKAELKRAAEAEKERRRAAQQAAKTNAATAAKPVTPASSAAVTNAPAELTPEQKKIAEVEARIDSMMKQKAEREKAAAQSTTNSPTKAPQTKRERLNALLKQMIEGKISDADYNTQRNKIVAEPD